MATILFMVKATIPSDKEAAFNRWYNEEHVPQVFQFPGLVSAHRYPYSACVRHSSPTYPSIARVLSDNATVGLARAVAPAVRLAEHAGFPFRLTGGLIFNDNRINVNGQPASNNTYTFNGHTYQASDASVNRMPCQ